MKLKDEVISFVKGVIVGLATLINGISSGAIILSLTIYNDVILGINNIFKKDNKRLYLIVIPTIIGIILSILAFKDSLDIINNKYYYQITFFFIGLMLTGLNINININIKKENIKFNKKKVITCMIVFILFLITSIIFINTFNYNFENGYIKSIILGALLSITIIIPGFSSKILFDKFNITKINYSNILILNNFLKFLIFIITFIIGIILICKLINYCLNKNKELTKAILITLLSVSIIIPFVNLKSFTYNFVNIFTTILAFLWGYIFAKNVEKE